jgi:hypothetical protein
VDEYESKLGTEISMLEFEVEMADGQPEEERIPISESSSAMEQSIPRALSNLAGKSAGLVFLEANLRKKLVTIARGRRGPYTFL